VLAELNKSNIFFFRLRTAEEGSRLRGEAETVDRERLEDAAAGAW
jgi:hypothetical protein